MTFHISLKNTSGWVLLMRQHSKKFLVKVNPPWSWPWKQNATAAVADVMILKVVNNWRSMLQVNILKKRLWTLIFLLQEIHAAITILAWLVSTWYICLTEILEQKHLKLSDHLNQIWGPLATLSALQSFGFFWFPPAKATHLQELAGCFRPRQSSDAQNRAFAKKAEIAFKS